MNGWMVLEEDQEEAAGAGVAASTSSRADCSSPAPKSMSISKRQERNCYAARKLLDSATMKMIRKWTAPTGSGVMALSLLGSRFENEFSDHLAPLDGFHV